MGGPGVTFKKAVGSIRRRTSCSMRMRPNGVFSLRISARTSGATELEVHAHEPELNDLAGALQAQEDLAGIAAFFHFLCEHFDIHQGAVVGLDRDGHMLVMHEEAAVGLRHLMGGDGFPGAHEVRRREEVQEKRKVGTKRF